MRFRGLAPTATVVPALRAFGGRVRAVGFGGRRLGDKPPYLFRIWAGCGATGLLCRGRGLGDGPSCLFWGDARTWGLAVIDYRLEGVVDLRAVERDGACESGAEAPH
jgi:hypothetical protein